MAGTWRFVVLVVFSAALCHATPFDSAWRAKELAKVPELVTLNAPYTPFFAGADQALDVDVVPALAANAKSLGVNTIWVGGGMGQFETLSVSERELLAAKWVESAHIHGMYVIVHVTSTVLSDAVQLARHAASIGADAVACLPPYYNQPATLELLFDFLRPIANAAGSLPMFYYHLPGMTHYNPNIFQLVTEARTLLPSLIGIKYVGSDMGDWFNTVQAYNNSHVLLFAPEPKLQAYGLGHGRGAVLAEDFYAATFLRMHFAYLRGQYAAAWAETEWKQKAEAVFSSFGGAAKREVYKVFCDVNMGPPRLPAAPFDASRFNALVSALRTLNFFNLTVPPTEYL